MVGRTWLQHATPVTLGMKLAGWLGAITRHRQRLDELKPRLLCLQFGGASGSLAALGEKGFAVAETLAEELDLQLPEQPWHTQRDRLVEFASLLGLMAGSLGKLGRDLSLLMQTEAGEVFEPAGAGRGGSSTMPHKRNPVGSCRADRCGHPCAGAGLDAIRRHAPGTRAQPRPLARRVGNPAGTVLSRLGCPATGARPSCSKAWRWTPSACSPTST